jgi:hypothetical protein
MAPGELIEFFDDATTLGINNDIIKHIKKYKLKLTVKCDILFRYFTLINISITKIFYYKIIDQ